jgi:hypothetical protein
MTSPHSCSLWKLCAEKSKEVKSAAELTMPLVSFEFDATLPYLNMATG